MYGAGHEVVSALCLCTPHAPVLIGVFLLSLLSSLLRRWPSLSRLLPGSRCTLFEGLVVESKRGTDMGALYDRRFRRNPASVCKLYANYILNGSLDSFGKVTGDGTGGYMFKIEIRCNPGVERMSRVAPPHAFQAATPHDGGCSASSFSPNGRTQRDRVSELCAEDRPSELIMSETVLH